MPLRPLRGRQAALRPLVPVVADVEATGPNLAATSEGPQGVMDIYEIARLHRDRACDEKARRFGEWEPEDQPESGPPPGDVAAWWYLQGKAEAYAAIMSEMESQG